MDNLKYFFKCGEVEIADLSNKAYVNQTKGMIQNGLEAWKENSCCLTEGETIHWTCFFKRVDTLPAGRAVIKYPEIITFYSQAGFPKKTLNLQNPEDVLTNILEGDEELRFLLYNFFKDQIIMKIIKDMSLLKVPS